MVSKLEALKKKKAKLLKKAGIKNANLASLRQRAAEERKIKAEIFALEHPESARARDTLKSAAGQFGKFVKRNASLVANNAVKIQKAKNEAAKKERAEERKVKIARLKAIKRVGSGAKKKSVKKSTKKKTAKKTSKKKSKGIDYGW